MSGFICSIFNKVFSKNPPPLDRHQRMAAWRNNVAASQYSNRGESWHSGSLQVGDRYEMSATSARSKNMDDDPTPAEQYKEFIKQRWASEEQAKVKDAR